MFMKIKWLGNYSGSAGSSNVRFFVWFVCLISENERQTNGSTFYFNAFCTFMCIYKRRERDKTLMIGNCNFVISLINYFHFVFSFYAVNRQPSTHNYYFYYHFTQSKCMCNCELSSFFAKIVKYLALEPFV